MSKITISIVSHGHDSMVEKLLDNLSQIALHISKVVVTHNLPENKNCSASAKKYNFRVTHITNDYPLGFSANHNKAFRHCDTPFFCVMNPDILIQEDPFASLLDSLTNINYAIVAPLVRNGDGDIEDSARYFPTPLSLIRKIILGDKGIFNFTLNDKFVFPDWVGGMFMLFPSEKYKKLSGFDEGYFLYYEDVDICKRSWELGYSVVLNTGVCVIHDARRSSHKDIKFLRFHLKSAFRFFFKKWKSPHNSIV